MCCLRVVDGHAMTDSVVADTCQPPSSSDEPARPSCDETEHRGEINHDLCTASATTADKNPAAAAVKTNGCSEHADVEDQVPDNCRADASCGMVLNGPKSVAADDTDSEKCSSSDLRTNACGGPNLGNFNSAVVPLIHTNGHIDV